MAVTFVNAAFRSNSSGTTLAITPGTGADYQMAGVHSGEDDGAFGVTFDGNVMDLLLSRIGEEGSPPGLFARSLRFHGLEGDYTGASRDAVWSISNGSQIVGCFADVHQESPVLYSDVFRENGTDDVTATISGENNPVGSRVAWWMTSFGTWSGSLTVNSGEVHAQNNDFGDSILALGSTAGTGETLNITVTRPNASTSDNMLFVVVLSSADVEVGPRVNTQIPTSRMVVQPPGVLGNRIIIG